MTKAKAKSKVRAKKSIVAKPSRAEMAKAIEGKHKHISNAVQKVLREAGLKGVSLHSIRLSVAHDLVSGPGCDPPCGPDEDCVVDSSGGHVRWVCVPR
jgi:hypothetical protein